jgi:hypothetical protein
MCPACITAMAWIAAGAASTGGLAALAAVKLGGPKTDKELDEHTHDQGDGYANTESGFTR